jgi:formylglycine-generating enzyme required for sulfatase activity
MSDPLLGGESPRPHESWCGELTDRERLRLPERYVGAPLSDAVVTAVALLRRAATQTLLKNLASPETPLAERIASGNLLALCGDPRIETVRPRMIDIPGGEVEIGLEPLEVSGVLERYSDLGLERGWIEKECPRHRVTLAPYRLAHFPVTNIEYRDFLLATGHPELPSSWRLRQFPLERANHPVYSVSARSAEAYAAWLERQTGRAFRLPTEPEWEWAAAGPTGHEFPWGPDYDSWRANTAETGLFVTSPVGAFWGGESQFGAADMAGNVEEYVATDYAPYPGGSLISDHLARIQGAYRVARGGSFARFRDLARTRRRHGHNPRSETYAMGFRLAETP